MKNSRYQTLFSLLLLASLFACKEKASSSPWGLFLFLSDGASSSGYVAPAAQSGVCSDDNSGKSTGAPNTGKVLITEVGSCPIGWIEIHNGTSTSVNLADYKLKTYYAYNGSVFAYNQIFALPTMLIPAGAFAIIRQNSSGTYRDFKDIMSLRRGDGQAVYVGNNDALELMKDGATVDFVRYGTNTNAPTTAPHWSGASAIALTCDSTRSLRRDAALSDTNSAADWTYTTGVTPHLPNTNACRQDADADGIPDCVEQPNIVYRGHDYYAWGSRTGRRDMFVEVDYLNQDDPACDHCPDRGMVPYKPALDKIRDAYAANGLYIHWAVGDLFDGDGIQGNNPAAYDICGGGTVPYVPAVEFGTVAGATNIYDIKREYMIGERSNIFHYLLFAVTLPAASWWGQASVGGNTTIIAQGRWNFNLYGNTFYKNYQADTTMHELGHNLGLRHGGNENKNFKPNYLSIMNYIYSGLPTVGTDDWSMYYNYDNACAARYGYTSYSSLDTYIIDYSNGTGAAIDETNFDENAGLGRASGIAVDFNCDGGIGSGISYDVNGDGTLDVLTDYDDWGNIAIFSAYYSDVTANDALASPNRMRDRRRRKERIHGYGRDKHGRPFTLQPGPGKYIFLDDALSGKMREHLHLSARR